jgi:predicted ribosome quality control (RQC) complex YloA/Tae2 family protein
LLPRMKSEMSAFDVMAVVAEMQPLVGGYLDKLFHWDAKNVLLRVNVPGTGRREVVILELHWLYVTTERPEVPETPSQFAVHARKLLSNARISAVRQHEFDRIVVVEVGKDPGYQIIVELFGEGNLLIVSEGTIINCLFSKTWKHRDVRPGASYAFPPTRFDPNTPGEEAFRKAVESSNADVVRTLATSVNLGGQYGEELCVRTGIDKRRKARDLTDEEISMLSEELGTILLQVREHPQATVFVRDGTPNDVAPIDLKQYGTEGRETFESVSAAIASYVERAGKLKQRAENPEVQRLARQIEQQSKVIEALEKEAVDHARQAEALYSNYQEASGLLSSFARATAGKGWDQAREAAEAFPSIVEVRPEDPSIRAKIGEVEIQLDYSKGLEENADVLYRKAKEARAKMRSAEVAVLDTKKKLEELKAKEALAASAREELAKPTKQFWFESYRWFVTSGGRLVLAGKDARTNDQLVKKHLTPTDRYAHADVHGAPSVVIKDGASASPEELREACQFALAHSKAWNAGAREGSAYWVLPDQVSKTPDAGEFVPRGAFIIRGKRNYEHHLPLELAVGEIDYQGARKVMCAPRSALGGSSRYVVIAPGDVRRSRLSSTLARTLKVPEEEVSRVMPPGDIEIKEETGLSLEL